MRTEQYLKTYDFTIPFSEGILEFYNKPEVELSQSGRVIAKGKVTDIRFCDEGELRIVDHNKGTDFLAFEMLIDGKYHGPFNSYIKTPPVENDGMKEFIEQAEKTIENL